MSSSPINQVVTGQGINRLYRIDPVVYLASIFHIKVYSVGRLNFMTFSSCLVKLYFQILCSLLLIIYIWILFGSQCLLLCYWHAPLSGFAEKESFSFQSITCGEDGADLKEKSLLQISMLLPLGLTEGMQVKE